MSDPSASSRSAAAPSRARSRKLYVRWALFLLGLLILTTGSFGSGLDNVRPLTSSALFVAMTLSSLLGVSVVGIVVLPWCVRPLERVCLAGLLYVSWRIAYFPAMQLAIVGSGLTASGLVQLTRLRPWIYPTFLILLAILMTASACLAVAPLVARRPWLVIPAWTPLLLAAMISLGGWEDVHVLPDRSFRGEKAAAERGPPQNGKPMAVESESTFWGPKSALHWPRRRLASWSYRLRGTVPWSVVVQSTLRQRWPTEVPPSATEHLRGCYAACLGAHVLVGKRQMLVDAGPGDHTRLLAGGRFN